MARKLSRDKGIPLNHAHRIVQGETTLNEVLKRMMRQDRIDRLVDHDGLDRSLAGQVASGHLSKKRALQLTRIRKVRKHRLDMDAIKVAATAGENVALNVFGRGWVTGKVAAARVYDFDLIVEGTEEPETLFKHEVKAVCSVENLTAVLSAMGEDAKLKAEGLGASADRADRVKPSDEELLKVMEEERTIQFLFRDGDLLQGKVLSFGRWDVQLDVAGEGQVDVLFHGLHAKSPLVAR